MAGSRSRRVQLMARKLKKSSSVILINCKTNFPLTISVVAGYKTSVPTLTSWPLKQVCEVTDLLTQCCHQLVSRNLHEDHWVLYHAAGSCDCVVNISINKFTLPQHFKTFHEDLSWDIFNSLDNFRHQSFRRQKTFYLRCWSQLFPQDRTDSPPASTDYKQSQSAHDTPMLVSNNCVFVSIRGTWEGNSFEKYPTRKERRVGGVVSLRRKHCKLTACQGYTRTPVLQSQWLQRTHTNMYTHLDKDTHRYTNNTSTYKHWNPCNSIDTHTITRINIHIRTSTRRITHIAAAHTYTHK